MDKITFTSSGNNIVYKSDCCGEFALQCLELLLNDIYSNSIDNEFINIILF